jgi:hypothetical protein
MLTSATLSWRNSFLTVAPLIGELVSAFASATPSTALSKALESPSSARLSRSDAELERVRVTRARQPGDLWTLFCDSMHFQTPAGQRAIAPNENIDCLIEQWREIFRALQIPTSTAKTFLSISETTSQSLATYSAIP